MGGRTVVLGLGEIPACSWQAEVAFVAPRHATKAPIVRNRIAELICRNAEPIVELPIVAGDREHTQRRRQVRLMLARHSMLPEL